jgi:hypothetical protein
VAAAVATAACGVALTACGSSAKNGNGARASVSGPLQFAACMRSHGVPNFPDPSSGGGIQLGPSVNPQSPAFQTAQKQCFKLLPGGGPPRGGPDSESRHLQLLKLSQCMRAHGLTTFPDPTSGQPSAPGRASARGSQASRGGLAFGGPGGFLQIPQSLVQSPAFKQAAKTCGFPGAGGPPGGQASPAP